MTGSAVCVFGELATVGIFEICFVVALGAEFSLGQDQKGFLARRMGLVAGQAGVGDGSVGGFEIARRGGFHSVMAHHAQIGFWGGEFDGGAFFGDRDVMAVCAIVFDWGVDGFGAARQFAMAHRTLRRIGTDQTRMGRGLGGARRRKK